jgi:hypothetical protein
MSDPRILGLTLMAISIAAFLGSTTEALPAETFFPAMLLFAIGAYKFLRSNHEAMSKAEERAARAVRPSMRENRNARALADRQAAAKAIGIAPSDAASVPHEDEPNFDTRDNAIELDVPAAVGQLNVMTDVSFPLEIQTGDALADQLSKLNKLLEQGVLTEEEYAIAKAKILG